MTSEGILSPEALLDFDEIEALPSSLPVPVWTGYAATSDATFCTYVVIGEDAEAYSGVLTFAQSPSGLEQVQMTVPTSQMPGDILAALADKNGTLPPCQMTFRMTEAVHAELLKAINDALVAHKLDDAAEDPARQLERDRVIADVLSQFYNAGRIGGAVSDLGPDNWRPVKGALDAVDRSIRNLNPRRFKPSGKSGGGLRG